MFTESKTLPISAIQQGVVVDHITAGQALNIIQLLKLSQSDNHIMLGLHLPSASMGTKDLIKIEEFSLSDEECDKIAILSPNATINLIDNFSVQEKMKLELPDKIAGITPCTNKKCITNHEKVKSLFVISKRGSLSIQLRCHYCRKQLNKISP